MKKPNCYECEWRRNLPYGDVHSKCVHPNLNGVTDEDSNPLGALLSITGRATGYPGMADLVGIKGNPHGIRKGWFNWPFNYDPVWVDSCNGFSEKEE